MPMVRITLSGPREMAPTPGSVRMSTCKPSSTMTPAATTCPASLVSASMPHRSSAAPSATMIPPATTVACTSEYANTRESAGSDPATRKPAQTPAYIARPPRRGVGTACTSRSRGSAMAPKRIAKRRATGVRR